MYSTVPAATEFKTKLGFNTYDTIMRKEQSVLIRIMRVFASENIATTLCFWGTELICIFLSINQQQKLMKIGKKKKKTENNTKELKDKKQQKKILIVHLLGLILIKRFLHNHIKKSPKKSLTDKTSKRI